MTISIPILSGGKPHRRANVLRDFTIRDFSGGWNVVDNDLNLSSKFSKKLQNMQRSLDGANEIRPGTRLYADAKAYLDEIINCHYFSANIWLVGLNGKMVRVDSTAKITLAWDDEIAYSLPGNPNGWGTTVFTSFAIFNGELVIFNGVNKPLRVQGNTAVDYLTDRATGSNAFTPIAKYVRAHGRYLVAAGFPDRPSVLSISATDSGGVWLGDAAPNDAVEIDLGSRVPSGDQTIKGLGRFRDKLVVAFDEALLPGTLGVFTGTPAVNHTPTFDDAIEEHGSISHRAIQTIGEDMLFADSVGVPSVSRALFTGNVKPDRLSNLIDPEIQKDIGRLKKVSSLEDRVFSVYDTKAGNYMLFIPNGDTLESTTETRGFVLKKNKKLKIEAWQEWKNWNWSSGCRSALKRIFFTQGTQLYILGNDEDVISADFVGDQETWDDGTVFTDGKGWNPVASIAGSGVPISFEWELPWADNDQRFLTKTSKYINFDTVGDERFTVQLFIDNIYEDRKDPGERWLEDDFLWDDDLGWDVDVLDPYISMEFTGGDSPGFGLDEYGRLYGGGRPTRLELLYSWPAKYKLAKHRIFGEALKPLKFVSMTVAYSLGTIRR